MMDEMQLQVTSSQQECAVCAAQLPPYQTHCPYCDIHSKALKKAKAPKFQIKESFKENKQDMHKERARLKQDFKYNQEGQ
jgi:gas vesicle protein